MGYRSVFYLCYPKLMSEKPFKIQFPLILDSDQDGTGARLREKARKFRKSFEQLIQMGEETVERRKVGDIVSFQLTTGEQKQFKVVESFDGGAVSSVYKVHEVGGDPNDYLVLKTVHEGYPLWSRPEQAQQVYEFCKHHINYFLHESNDREAGAFFDELYDEKWELMGGSYASTHIALMLEHLITDQLSDVPGVVRSKGIGFAENGETFVLQELAYPFNYGIVYLGTKRDESGELEKVTPKNVFDVFTFNLSLAKQLIQLTKGVHEHKLALADVDTNKFDRFKLDVSGRHLVVVDWNITHGALSQNQDMCYLPFHLGKMITNKALSGDVEGLVIKWIKGGSKQLNMDAVLDMSADEYVEGIYTVPKLLDQVETDKEKPLINQLFVVHAKLAKVLMLIAAAKFTSEEALAKPTAGYLNKMMSTINEFEKILSSPTAEALNQAESKLDGIIEGFRTEFSHSKEESSPAEPMSQPPSSPDAQPGEGVDATSPVASDEDNADIKKPETRNQPPQVVEVHKGVSFVLVDDPENTRQMLPKKDILSRQEYQKIQPYLDSIYFMATDKEGKITKLAVTLSQTELIKPLLESLADSLSVLVLSVKNTVEAEFEQLDFIRNSLVLPELTRLVVTSTPSINLGEIKSLAHFAPNLQKLVLTSAEHYKLDVLSLTDRPDLLIECLPPIYNKTIAQLTAENVVAIEDNVLVYKEEKEEESITPVVSPELENDVAVGSPSEPPTDDSVPSVTTEDNAPEQAQPPVEPEQELNNQLDELPTQPQNESQQGESKDDVQPPTQEETEATSNLATDDAVVETEIQHNLPDGDQEKTIASPKEVLTDDQREELIKLDMWARNFKQKVLKNNPNRQTMSWLEGEELDRWINNFRDIKDGLNLAFDAHWSVLPRVIIEASNLYADLLTDSRWAPDNYPKRWQSLQTALEEVQGKLEAISSDLKVDNLLELIIFYQVALATKMAEFNRRTSTEIFQDVFSTTETLVNQDQVLQKYGLQFSAELTDALLKTGDLSKLRFKLTKRGNDSQLLKDKEIDEDVGTFVQNITLVKGEATGVDLAKYFALRAFYTQLTGVINRLMEQSDFNESQKSVLNHFMVDLTQKMLFIPGLEDKLRNTLTGNLEFLKGM